MASDSHLTLPPISREQVAVALRSLGLGRGDAVFVHSSLSRIGNVEGGAEAVVDAFLEVVGAEGTLAVPTIPYHGSMRAHLEARPFFDVRATPSFMGAITEAVRRHPRAVRSREPTHPVAAIGAGADFLTRDHLLAQSPCDQHSPYFRLTRIDAWYLLLGVDFRSCTLLHGAEEIARVPFLDLDTRYEVSCRDGDEEYCACIACHSTPHHSHFSAIEPVLAARGRLVRGKVGCAECRMARAAEILDTALDELARDPFFLRQRPANPP